MLARYARHEVRLIAAVGGLVSGATAWAFGAWAAAPLALTLALLAFFRDPPRRCPAEAGVLYAPADGRILDIQRHSALAGQPGRYVRILIFLSVFSVHVNRSPCAGTVRAVVHRPGRFTFATRASAADVNESCTILLEPPSPLPVPVLVRQIAGGVARRIVCAAPVNQALACGQRYGMIKLGSQTELAFPESSGWHIDARVGQRVRGGLTALARWTTTSKTERHGPG